MGVEVLDSSLDPNEMGDEVFEDDTVSSAKHSVDARRRLEDKLEELRLQRELRDYDFDM